MWSSLRSNNKLCLAIRKWWALILLALLVGIIPVILQGGLLWMQTGSLVLMDYNWYRLDVAGYREHHCSLPQFLNSTQQRCCYADLPPLQWLDEDDSSLRNLNAGRKVRVHITLKGGENGNSLNPSSASSSYETEGSHLGLPDSDATLFPYLWDVILRNGEFVQEESFHRYFPEANIEFIVSPDWRDLTSNTISSAPIVIVVGDSVDSIAKFNLFQLHRPAAMIALAGETCNTPMNEGISPDNIPFGFITYGDCSIVDDQRCHLWPLGPKIAGGFPANVDPATNPPMNERRYFMNLMTSFTRRKPTRMQAWLTVHKPCQREWGPCYMSQTNILHDVISEVIGSQFANFFLGTNTNSDYIEVLKQSKLTLCPSGHNPEQYRIWEAMASGSIPVVELPTTLKPGTFCHPAAPNDWNCLPEYLRDLQAPVYVVGDWARDLPSIMSSITDETLQKRQHELKVWYSRFLRHLRLLLFKMIRTHFRAEQNEQSPPLTQAVLRTAQSFYSVLSVNKKNQLSDALPLGSEDRRSCSSVFSSVLTFGGETFKTNVASIKSRMRTLLLPGDEVGFQETATTTPRV